jgi:tetratricopeptide (TPR) repeat protein
LKAIEINKRSFGEYHIEYAITLGNLSGVLKNLGDYEGAIYGYLKVLEIYKRIFGEDHVEYARTLQNLSSVFYNLGEYKVAI